MEDIIHFFGIQVTCKSTKDSFIFSFTDKNNLQSAKVVYSNGGVNSIYGGSTYGPYFGSSDLYFHCDYPDYWNNIVTYSYPTINLPQILYVDDYEVFQIIKNSQID